MKFTIVKWSPGLATGNVVAGTPTLEEAQDRVALDIANEANKVLSPGQSRLSAFSYTIIDNLTGQAVAVTSQKLPAVNWQSIVPPTTTSVS